jgi:hypothetical protein
MKFIKYFFLSTPLLFVALYGYIVAVDPYNKLGYNLFGFETKAVDFPRVNKFNQLEHTTKSYEAFILGSSAAHRYHTGTVKKLTGYKTYNYAVQSATPEDYLAMFNHITSRFDPKLIIISIDFYGLNKHHKTDEMFFLSPLKDYLKEATEKRVSERVGIFNKTYFTLSALVDSLQVAWVNLFGESRHAYLEDGNYMIEREANPYKQVVIGQFPYPPYDFDQDRIEYYKEIKRRSDQLGIKLIVFTSPISYSHWLRIDKNELLKKRLQEFKDILGDIFGKVHDFNNEKMEFYEYPQYFGDSTHPSVMFSQMILEKVLEN